jgi:hypothetical protein
MVLTIRLIKHNAKDVRDRPRAASPGTLLTAPETPEESLLRADIRTFGGGGDRFPFWLR